MRKEVILAIIFGGILGGVILYGINLANNSVQSNNPQAITTPTPLIPSSAITPAPTSSALNITYPENHSVFFENSTTLKGTTTPNANVVVLTEANEVITTADNNGSFSSPVDLIAGENQITVTSYDTKDASTSASISIIYTSNKID